MIPDPAPLGAELSFRLTVTNVSDAPGSFQVDGCPVHYRLDGRFSPVPSRCKKIRRRFDLAPGESVVFDPKEAPHLAFKPGLFPLGPGRHRLVMAIEEVGGADTEFTVLPPSDFSFAGGRVLLPGNAPLSEGFVILHRGHPSPEETGFRTPLSPQGYFLFTTLEPGEYTLEVKTKGKSLWYPDLSGAADARPLTLSPKEYRNLDLVLPGGKTTFPVLGTVLKTPPDGEASPLEGAVVVAIPEDLLPEDRGPGDASFADSWREARTGNGGEFRLDLPAGSYLLLAGKLGDVRYGTWASTSDRPGERLRVPGDRPDNPIRFELAPLPGSPLSVVEGAVFTTSSLPGVMPKPIEGAEVVAVPILPSAIAAAPQRTRTGEEGRFSLEVPADTPYLIRAGARGFEFRFHQSANRAEDAEWVETEPGSRISGIEFFLSRTTSRDRGTIEGTVVRRLPQDSCSEGDDCLVPARGVRVRVVPANGVFGPRRYQGRSGPDGRFTIDGLKTGCDYFVSVGGEGETGYFPGGVPFSGAATLAVVPRKIADAGRITLPTEGSTLSGNTGFLGGTVTDEGGKPLPGIMVRAHPEPEHPGSVSTARTDAAGRFWISGLPEEVPILVSAGGRGYIPVYLSGVHRWAEAKLIQTGESESRNLEFILKKNPENGRCRVGGRVDTAPEVPSDHLEAMVLSSSDPDPVQGAFFYLLDPFTGDPVAGGITAENGTVFLDGLPQGTYCVAADHPGFESPPFPSPGDPAARILLDAEATPVVVLKGLETGKAETPLPEPELLVAAANIPNPFRPLTSIRYRLLEPAPVTLQVFDYRGRLVRTLLTLQEQGAGPQEVSWDARGEDGQRVSAGVYFFRVLAGTAAVSKKMVVLP